MKTNRILISISICIFITQFSLGASKESTVKKSLPLDGSSNVVMKTRENSHYLPNKVIVKLQLSPASNKTGRMFGIANIDNLLGKYSIESVSPLFPQQGRMTSGQEVAMSKFYTVKFSSPIDAFTLAAELSKLPEIQYAEPWFIYPVNDIQACRPNDPSRSAQWGLDKILADTAWCIEQGDTSVVIGIIDTGVQWDHPDLQANIWTNTGEYGPDGVGGRKESNVVDDDGNGKIDDWHGWDFGGADYRNPVEDNNPSPMSAGERTSHGTHVAGIASASTNNGVGVSGTGYRCRILPVKVTSDNDVDQFIDYGFQGMIYAAMMGAKIINCSWGGDGASQAEQDFIDITTSYGALVVAAAGNTFDNVPQYPASYRGVLSVAATTSTDTKASYSSYNEYVDVSAPGDAILSTIYQNAYSSSYSGTSMATPFVCGLAALVKSHFPSYTNMQVGEQVRVSCDNINSSNQSYVDLLGKGRINALKALTISSPSLRLSSFETKDSAGGNNNGILQPGEIFSLRTFITNYLSPTNPGAVITLSTTDTYVQVNTSSYPIGVIGTMATLSNSASPFQVLIKSNVPQAHEVRFKLTISDGSYSDVQFFWVLINPTFATHDVNNVGVTLTNIGRIGYTTDQHTGSGAGFIYNGADQLFEGGLIIGNSATKLVDVVRNDSIVNPQDHDFTAAQIYDMLYPGTMSAQDGKTIFTDSLAAPLNKLGIRVEMYSYAFTTPDDSNYVIVRYDIYNTSGVTISDLYAGLFFDWDVVGDQSSYWDYNRTSFDPSYNLGYAWNAGTPSTVYCGVRALEGEAGYRGLINNLSISLDRATKWSWINGGVIMADSIQDIHFVISSGPFTIANGAKKMIGFALIGGRNIGELQGSADAAAVKWFNLKKLVGVSEEQSGIPTVYTLKQNYPNPFNPVTTIKYELPTASRVELKVFDLLGRQIATLVQQEQAAGRYSIQFDASRLSSGIYYYRLTADEFSDSRKLMILK